MSGSSSGPAFDQGLFLAHFTKGREAYDARRYDEAASQLQEACLLRPRDLKVLNLLGLTYFKQDLYDKAEEIYRKLVAESPEAQTLHYNLGLIYFKLNRLEESESAFLKAQELSEENPKIGFYLGSIYERQRRFQDAIFQYRQAGASIMVRRVEDKLAATDPQTAPAAQAPARPGQRVDTARFRSEEVRAAIRRAEEALPPRTLRPVGEGVLTPEGPRPTSETARINLTDLTLPGGRSPALREGPTAPVRVAPERFRLLENSLLEIEVDGKVFIKPGTVSSYLGPLTFWVKERRAGGHPSLAIVTGKGRVLLKDRGHEVTFLQVEDSQYVEPSHLLACEESLSPRFVEVAAGDTRAEFVLLEGKGLVALSVAGRPLGLVVTPDMPLTLPAATLVTWSGRVQPEPVTDPELYENASLEARGAWVRLAGDGRVLVEQGAP